MRQAKEQMRERKVRNCLISLLVPTHVSPTQQMREKDNTFPLPPLRSPAAALINK